MKQKSQFQEKKSKRNETIFLRGAMMDVKIRMPSCVYVKIDRGYGHSLIT